MKFGILGTGTMATTLGRLWTAQGHQVFFGGRDPHKAHTLAAKTGSAAGGGSMAEAAAFGEVVALCVSWRGAQETVRAAGPLADKIIIDVTNPFGFESGLIIGLTNSAAEQVARWSGSQKVVKAFNTISVDNLDRPVFDGQTASFFYCGDDDDAKEVVAGIGRELGFAPVDCGPLWMARQLEPMGYLWVYLANQMGMGSNMAFKLLQRDGM